LSPAANTLPSSKAPEVEVLPPEPVTVDDFIGAITQLWQDAQQRFLAIGDYLARARGALSPEQYALLKARLPFGKAVHSQLMMAYRAIKDGMLPETAAAAGYSVVYLAATLSDGERRQAMAEGVIRPDMRRSDLLAFRRRLRPAATRDTDLATLKRERERLLERVAEIDRQLQEVGAEP
ncbi:MAG TPA: hypothetical protein VEB64_11480, partial [Azospirillaceae bacterium]|nr:hypothetical protein [Azospirillaceae bacterium]